MDRGAVGHVHYMHAGRNECFSINKPDARDGKGLDRAPSTREIIIQMRNL